MAAGSTLLSRVSIEDAFYFSLQERLRLWREQDAQKYAERIAPRPDPQVRICLMQLNTSVALLGIDDARHVSTCPTFVRFSYCLAITKACS